MTKNLILSFLVLCIISSFVNSSPGLHNLCQQDVFKYKDDRTEEIEVNMVYKSPASIKLDIIGNFLFNPSEEFWRINPKELREEMYKISEEYQKRVKTLYSESFINRNLSKIYEEETSFKNLKIRAHSVLKDQNRYLKEVWLGVMKRGHKLAQYLSHYLENKFNQTYFPNREHADSAHSRILEKSLNKIEVDEQYKMVIDEIEEFIKKPLVQMTNFKIKGGSKESFSYYQYGIIYFDFEVPFHNPDYEPTKDCIPLKELTKFFKNKGKE